MIPFGTRIHFATQPADFRKSINGLSGEVRMVLADDPLSGHLFVFYNKRRTGIKILWWAQGGYCLFYKRLAKGRFRVKAIIEKGRTKIPVTPAELSAMLEGIDLTGTKRTRLWRPAKKHS